MKSTTFLVQASVIAAVYAMQVRVSEALAILPYFTPAAIPGLFIGCLVSNTVGPYGLMDMVLGSGATLIAAVCSYYLRSWPLLVPLPPVVANGIAVGSMLYFVYEVPMPLIVCMLWVRRRIDCLLRDRISGASIITKV
ncbi:MAG TPA: QueT transporter family protein [Anaerovoracaceae bacterium]|nr:QueT transporter family protein [Anaerovoracaceae bacterium]